MLRRGKPIGRMINNRVYHSSHALLSGSDNILQNHRRDRLGSFFENENGIKRPLDQPPKSHNGEHEHSPFLRAATLGRSPRVPFV